MRKQFLKSEKDLLPALQQCRLDTRAVMVLNSPMIAEKDNPPPILVKNTLEALLQQTDNLPAFPRNISERDCWVLVEAAFDLPAHNIQSRRDITPTEYRALVSRYRETVVRIREARNRILKSMTLDAIYPLVAKIRSKAQSFLEGEDGKDITPRGLRDLAGVCTSLLSVKEALEKSSDTTPHPKSKPPPAKTRKGLEKALSGLG